MIFESNVQVLGAFPSFPQSTIREELSQSRTSISEAMKAGPIHRAFIESLPSSWQSDPTVEIFSRALWLKEGWYPLTPHYHFDWGRGVESAKVETIMVCLGDASLTEFILGPLDHPEQRPSPGARPPQGERNHWNDQVEAGLHTGKLRSWRIEADKLMLFDNRALHRAMPASKTGWRVLVRAILGLGEADDKNQESGYGSPGAFTTSRNGFVPETDGERARYEPYRV